MPKPKLTPKQLDDLDMMKASTFYGGRWICLCGGG